MKYAIYILVLASTIAVLPRLAYAEGVGIGGVSPVVRMTGGSGRPSSDGLTALGFTTGTRAGSIGHKANPSNDGAINRPTNDGYSATGGSKRMVGGRAPGYDDIAGGKTHNPQIVRGVGTFIASPGGVGH